MVMAAIFSFVTVAGAPIGPGGGGGGGQSVSFVPCQLALPRRLVLISSFRPICVATAGLQVGNDTVSNTIHKEDHSNHAIDAGVHNGQVTMFNNAMFSAAGSNPLGPGFFAAGQMGAQRNAAMRNAAMWDPPMMHPHHPRRRPRPRRVRRSEMPRITFE